MSHTYNFRHFKRKLNVVNDDECEKKTTRMRRVNRKKKIEIKKDIVTNMLAFVESKNKYALHKGVENLTENYYNTSFSLSFGLTIYNGNRELSRN